MDCRMIMHPPPVPSKLRISTQSIDMWTANLCEALYVRKWVINYKYQNYMVVTVY